MVKVLHIINTLANEGAPALLLSFLKNFNVQYCQSSVAYIYGDGELVKEKQWGKHTEIFDLTNNGKFNLFSIYRLVRIIKTKKIDIVHLHLVHASILGNIAARIAGIKYIVSTRHYGYHYKESTFLYRLERRLTRSVSVVIAISEAVKKYLIQENVIPEERIVVIHNAIDLKAINSEPATPTIQKKTEA